MPKSNFEDVQDFQRKFVPEAVPQEPVMMSSDVTRFRIKFMQEELDEFTEAFHDAARTAAQGELTESKRREYLAHMGDALIDLVYVALGTADLMGLPWQEMWDEVQRANMTKERAQSAESSKRGHSLDVIKPEGWTPPDHLSILALFMARRTETGRFHTIEPNMTEVDRG